MDRLLSAFGDFGLDARLGGADSFCDRLNCRVTVFVLIIFAMMVTAKFYVSDPIACWCPAHFEDSHVEYTNKQYVLYKVRHGVVATAAGHLTLSVDDIVRVQLPWRYPGNPMSPAGWLNGDLNGREGLVPSSHIEYWGEEYGPHSPSPPLPPPPPSVTRTMMQHLGQIQPRETGTLTVTQFLGQQRSSDQDDVYQTIKSGLKRRRKAIVVEQKQITIGLLHWNPRLKKLLPRVAAIPVQVSSHANPTEILSAGLAKHRAFNENEVTKPDAQYLLLFPNRTMVRSIPGSQTEFVLHKYKEAIGKAYSRLLLYLCDIDSYGAYKQMHGGDGNFVEKLIDEQLNENAFPDEVDEISEIDSDYEAADTPTVLLRRRSNFPNQCGSRVIPPTPGIMGPPHEINAPPPPEITAPPPPEITAPPPPEITAPPPPEITAPPPPELSHQTLSEYDDGKHANMEEHEEERDGTSYDNYVDILGSPEGELDYFDDDASIQIAIHDSLADESNTSEATLKDLLAPYLSQGSGKTTLVIHRKKLWMSTLRSVKLADFSFIDVPVINFAGEEAEDDGGPRREFFTLLMKEIPSIIMSGEPGNLTFSLDLAAVRERKYFLCGKFVAWSLVHGGPGLTGLSDTVLQLMINEDADIDINDLQVVTDVDTKERIGKLSHCSCAPELKVIAAELADWLIDQGVTNPNKISMENRDNLVSDLLRNHLYYRVQSAIMQFKEGLGDIWSLIMAHPRVGGSLLVGQKMVLNFQSFRALYEITWSEEGSNKREEENDTIFCWECFLQECTMNDAKITLNEILQFWTGGDIIPPCGFPVKLSLSFFSREPHVKRLPSASTCAMIMWIPRGIDDPDEFTQLMEFAIRGSHGFGKI